MAAASWSRVLVGAGFLMVPLYAAADTRPGASINSAATGGDASSGGDEGGGARGTAASSGAFNTAVAIELPAVRGRSPNLAFAYDSRASEGPYGLGWGLSGLSSIRRAAPGNGVPHYNDPSQADTFYLDGLELFPCSAATHATPGCSYSAATAGLSYYTTKNESGLRVAYDAAKDAWTVWRPDGFVRTYEVKWTTGSRLSFEWLLSGEQDPAADYTAAYTYQSSAPVPTKGAQPLIVSTIAYGPYSVVFNYDYNVNYQSFAIGDSTLAPFAARLRSLDVQFTDTSATPPTTTVRSYALSYGTSAATTRTLLTRIRQLGQPSGPTPAPELPPHDFRYDATDVLKVSESVHQDLQVYATVPSVASGASLSVNVDLPADVMMGGDDFPLRMRHVDLDFNGDRRTDHAIVTWSDSKVTVLPFRTTPSGPYAALAPLSIAATNFPSSVSFLVADFNGDGHDDILITGHQSANDPGNPSATQRVTALVYYNATTGAFESTSAYNLPRISDADSGLTTSSHKVCVPDLLFAIITGFHPCWNEEDYDTINYDKDQIIAGDLDGDGNADLLRVYSDIVDKGTVANYYYVTYRGRGDGSFLAPVAAPAFLYKFTGAEPGFVRATLADFRDGGGKSPRFKVFKSTTAAPTIGCYSGIPAGIDFGPPICGNAKTTTWTMADVNGDGIPEDIWFRAADGSTSDKAAQIQIDVQAAGWSRHIDLNPVDHSTPWRIVDANGDGLLDFMAIRTPFGECAGNFPLVTPVVVQALPRSADRAVDYRVVSEAQVAINMPCGPTTIMPWPAQSIDIDDHDGDGIPDISTWMTPTPGSGLFYADAKGAFDPLAYVRLIVTLNPKVIYRTSQSNDLPYRDADLNGDGFRDLVKVQGNPGGFGLHVEAIIRQPNNTLGRMVKQDIGLGAFNFSSLTPHIGDVNGDGRDDLVFTLATVAPDTTKVRFLALLSFGDGTFEERAWEQILPATWQRMTSDDHWYMLDQDGDGRKDLVYMQAVTRLDAVSTPCYLSQTFTAFTFRSTDTGFAAPKLWSVTTCGAPWNARDWNVVDLDGDGKQDLAGVWVDQLNTNRYVTVALLSDGAAGYRSREDRIDAGFAVNSTFGVPPSRWSAASVDRNQSGDLVGISASSRTATLLRGRGDGSFDRNFLFLGGRSEAVDWRLADVDADGAIDFVNVGSPTYVFFTRPDGTAFKTTYASFTAPAPTTADIRTVVSDLDGDGYPEIENRRFYSTFEFVCGTGGCGKRSDFIAVDRVQLHTGTDRLVQVTSPLGGKTTVEYGATFGTQGQGTRINDPAGGCMLPVHGGQVVHSLTVDPGAGLPTETTFFGYECPGWLQSERRQGGWKKTYTMRSGAANHPFTWVLADYDIGETCGARATHVSASDGYERSGGPPNVRSRDTSYVPAGGLPYQCAIDQSTTTEIDPTGTKLVSAIRYEYDEFGLAKLITEIGDASVGGRKRVTAVTNAIAAETFVVKPIVNVIKEGAVELQRTMYCYDTPEIAGCKPPTTKGLVTGVRRIKDDGTFAVTRFSYDAYGNITTVMDPNRNSTIVTYDTSHRFPHYVINARAQVTEELYDAAIGALVRTRDANGVSVYQTYDAFGRLETRTTDDGGGETISYQSLGTPGVQSVRSTVADGTPAGIYTEQVLDGLGRSIRVRRSDGATRTIGFTDASPRPGSVSDWSTGTGTPMVDTLSYDFLGRKILVQHADGSKITIRPFANRQETTDEFGNKRTAVFDSWNQLRRVEEPDPAHATTYEYDAMDRMVRSADPAGNLITRSYDMLGRVRLATDPDLGTVQYGYDDVGNLLRRTDGRKVATDFGYDALGRIVTRTNTTSSVTYHYDEPGATYGVGRLTSVEDDDSGTTCGRALDLDYDMMGRVTSAIRCLDGDQQSLTRSYDVLGRPTKLTFPDSAEVTYTYDGVGRLKTMPGYVQDLTYDPSGRLKRVQLANGVVESYSYSAKRGWLDNVTITDKTGTVLRSSIYKHRLDSLLEGESTVTNLRTSVTENVGYQYDDRARLVGTTGARTESFAYDLIGNMLTKNGVKYTYPTYGAGQPRVHAVATIGTMRNIYDDGGNLLCERDVLDLITDCRVGVTAPRRIFTWDDDSRLIGVLVPAAKPKDTIATSYTYGPSGERTREIVVGGKKDSTTYTFFPELETDGSKNITKHIFAGGRRIATVVGKGPKVYYHGNHVGSVVLMTDESGGLVKDGFFQYDSFGGRSVGDPDTSNRFAFTGERQGDGTAPSSMTPGLGLVHMGARDFDPSTARFISPDTLAPQSGVMGRNRYAYAFQNPIAFIDPTGHFGEEPPPAGWNTDGTPMQGTVDIGTHDYYSNGAWNSVPDGADLMVIHETYQPPAPSYAYSSFDTGSWGAYSGNLGLQDSVAGAQSLYAKSLNINTYQQVGNVFFGSEQVKQLFMNVVADSSIATMALGVILSTGAPLVVHDVSYNNATKALRDAGAAGQMIGNGKTVEYSQVVFCAQCVTNVQQANGIQPDQGSAAFHELLHPALQILNDIYGVPLLDENVPRQETEHTYIVPLENLYRISKGLAPR